MLVLARADDALPADDGTLAVLDLGRVEGSTHDPPVRPTFLLARQQRQGVGEEVKVAEDLLLDLPASSRVLGVEEGGIDDVVQVVLVAGAELAQVCRVHQERERVLVGQALVCAPLDGMRSWP